MFNKSRRIICTVQQKKVEAEFYLGYTRRLRFTADNKLQCRYTFKLKLEQIECTIKSAYVR